MVTVPELTSPPSMFMVPVELKIIEPELTNGLEMLRVVVPDIDMLPVLIKEPLPPILPPLQVEAPVK